MQNSKDISVARTSSHLMSIEISDKVRRSRALLSFRDPSQVSDWEWSSLKYHQMLVGCNHDNFREIIIKQSFYTYSPWTILTKYYSSLGSLI